MSREVLADTGPLYAAADPEDAHHGRAHRELKRLAREKRGVVVAYPTLLEAYTLVLYRLGKQAASNWLNDILSGSTLWNPDPEDYPCRRPHAGRIQRSTDHLVRCHPGGDV